MLHTRTLAHEFSSKNPLFLSFKLPKLLKYLHEAEQSTEFKYTNPYEITYVQNRHNISYVRACG